VVSFELREPVEHPGRVIAFSLMEIDDERDGLAPS
jgi:hypothetical protein